MITWPAGKVNESDQPLIGALPVLVMVIDDVSPVFHALTVSPTRQDDARRAVVAAGWTAAGWTAAGWTAAAWCGPAGFAGRVEAEERDRHRRLTVERQLVADAGDADRLDRRLAPVPP